MFLFLKVINTEDSLEDKTQKYIHLTQKRSLYITIVRSLFEHCGEIWAPNAVVAEQKFEPIQKKKQ